MTFFGDVMVMKS